MVLISGVLKGPYGDARTGVTITMRSLKTSSTVLNLAKSQSVTNDSGQYSLNVEPGAYEIIISVYGAQPERVGTIEVYADSLPGALNDFLRRPGESDITPEIIQTVDRMRVDAAASADKSAESAAAAKQSEDNSAATLATAVKESSRAVIVPAVVNAIGNFQGYLKLVTLPITNTGVNGVHFMVAAGRTYGTPGMDIKFVQFSARNASTTALDSRGLKVASLGPAGQDVKFGAIYNAQTARWELWMLGPAYSMPSVSILASSSSNAMSGIELLKDNTWQKTKPDGFTPVAEDKIYSGYNVTVDGNGFLKAASPIARLSSTPENMPDDYLEGFALAGCAAVNKEAEGVSAERVSVGVYKVTGSLGFAEEGWNIEVPQDVNGNRLCFVETSTGKDGTIYVKVSKRRFDIDTAAIVAGDPMDIPNGRWIDLRLEMQVVEPIVDPDEGSELQ
ncbi:prophage tail fiber N-terminal domain-containing protein [Serratia liquefaciens]|uniref:prophage tail fiber N-terminal domain-containing protein n=1 Tax=Serratia liquefaciens TaxID=614 RepID=UPI002183DF97|nr:prophage tail fiber N-terminal domain-containing protein [Serratia liquefaciens]CAI2538090.1 Prophage tail fibre N-terminal [Serratia liquefaciens]